MADISKSHGEDYHKAQEEGAEVVIVFPETGEPIGLTIWVAGPDSKRQVAARNHASNQLMRSQVTGGARMDIINANNRTVMAKSTVRWEWGMGPDGTPCTFSDLGGQPECSSETAKAMYDKYEFIFEQVQVVGGNRTGFTKT